MARLPDEEIQRRLAEAREKVRISDEAMDERWSDLEPEKREIRRRLAETAAAKHLVVVDDDTGQRLLGGPQPSSGHRTKKDAIQTIVDLVDGERQREFVEAMFAPLDANEPAAVRGKGAERIAKLKIEFEEKERRDRDELRSLGKDELIDRIVKGLMANGMDEDLLKKLTPAKDFDAEVTDVVELH